MKTIYLDNAATTPLLPEVIESITDVMKTTYGNPSSTHQIGRKAKALVENSRKSIANLLNATSSEIFFTAGGSEADNLILHNAVVNLGVKTIISSKIEHHAVVHTIEHLKEKYNIEVKWVNLNTNGAVDYNHLEELLEKSSKKVLVSLMYVNNEIGNLLDLKKVSDLCVKNDALFHSDTVQGIGHFDVDVSKTPIDFFTASAHKFHGPKGVGFAYIKKGIGVQPLLFGGEQEKGARAGTENLHSIYGLQKAMEIACTNLKDEAKSIQLIKNYFINSLKTNFEGIKFNGLSESETESSYIILNVRFPKAYPMLLFNLDLKGIAASGGSACQSGSSKGSHVLHEILEEKETLKTSVRFSFSKFTTKEDIDYVISELKKIDKIMLNYALKFKPILKQKIWGGNKLTQHLHKDSKDKNIGESWEISDVDDNISIVSNGKLKGSSLKELVQKYKGSLVGDKNYQTFNDKFPLLIKFIDASQDLSVQVHPNNELAKKRHNSFGKTEMWYIMEAKEKSNLVLGFSKEVSPNKYKALLKEKAITTVLNFEKIKKGDAFFIETGTVHAIGAGVVLAEIQQTSDITYRIYDWDRVDAAGNSRELHTDLAIEAINFSTKLDAKRNYNSLPNELNPLINCPYFKTNFISVNKTLNLNYSKKDSFVIFMCVEGNGTISINNNTETISYGETILIPAVAKEVLIKSDHCKLLEVTV